MSGIYLIVWDNQQTGILKPGKGGNPHITLAYTGKLLARKELLEISHSVLDSDWLMKTVTISHARVNTFFAEKVGKDRHDVLLILDEKDKIQIEETRDKLLRTHPEQDKFSMHEPHITEGIYWSREEAEEALTKLSSCLPLQVVVTGLTFD